MTSGERKKVNTVVRILKGILRYRRKKDAGTWASLTHEAILKYSTNVT